MAEIQNNKKNMTKRDVISIFFIKGRIFTFTLLGVIIMAVAIALLVPEKYRVEAQMVVKPRIDSPTIFDRDLSRINIDYNVDTKTINTVIQLMQSSALMERVVQKIYGEELKTTSDIKDKANNLKSRFSVTPLSLSNMIGMQLTGTDPEVITKELNTIIDEYIAYHIKINQDGEEELIFFDTQAKYYKKKFEQLNDELAFLSTELDVTDQPQQSTHYLRLIENLENKKIEASTRLSELTEMLAVIRTISAGADNHNQLVGLPSEILQRYPALIEMEKTFAQLIINKQRAESDFQPGSKRVVDANEQLNNMKRKLHDYILDILGTLEKQLDEARNEISRYEQDIAENNNKMKLLSGNSISMERLRMEHQLAKANYQLYETKAEEARINDAKNKAMFANLSVATRPDIPSNPWFPQMDKVVLASVAFGLVLAMIMALVAHSTDPRIRAPLDVTYEPRFRYLGSLDDMS